MVDLFLRQRLRPARGLRTRRHVAAGRTVRAAVLAGLAMLGMLIVASVAIYGESPGTIPRLMAAIVLGPSALEPQDEIDLAVAATGLAVHCVLALVYTLALATLVKDLPRGAAPAVGLAFGIALYFANLYGFTQLFPWFAPLRTVDTVAAHALFGLVAARVLVPGRHR
jgi:hypothetical protein